MFDAGKFDHLSEEELIKHQRYLIRRMNLMANENRNISTEEFLERQKDFDMFTEWLWNKEKP